MNHDQLFQAFTILIICEKARTQERVLDLEFFNRGLEKFPLVSHNRIYTKLLIGRWNLLKR